MGIRLLFAVLSVCLVSMVVALHGRTEICPLLAWQDDGRGAWPQKPFIIENSNYETPICIPSTGLGQSPCAGAARQSFIQKQRGHPAHEV